MNTGYDLHNNFNSIDTSACCLCWLFLARHVYTPSSSTRRRDALNSGRWSFVRDIQTSSLCASQVYCSAESGRHFWDEITVIREFLMETIKCSYRFSAILTTRKCLKSMFIAKDLSDNNYQDSAVRVCLGHTLQLFELFMSHGWLLLSSCWFFVSSRNFIRFWVIHYDLSGCNLMKS